MPFVAPDPQCMVILQDSDFADAYRLQPIEPGLDAIVATERIMTRVPRWILLLLALRNLLVAPFGLKGAGDRLPDDPPRMGLFPLLSRTPTRVVLGLDDLHLDFRLVIDTPGDGTLIGTTLVRTHNRMGRIYLRLIMPFHRVIVPRMMRQALPGAV
jgi:Protein of unknown function (DUF2867)